jgi:hypothetical protein
MTAGRDPARRAEAAEDRIARSRAQGRAAVATKEAAFAITGVSEPLPYLGVGGGRMDRWSRLPRVPRLEPRWSS